MNKALAINNLISALVAASGRTNMLEQQAKFLRFIKKGASKKSRKCSITEGDGKCCIITEIIIKKQ
jgi:hypothetical protein